MVLSLDDEVLILSEVKAKFRITLPCLSNVAENVFFSGAYNICWYKQHKCV